MWSKKKSFERLCAKIPKSVLCFIELVNKHNELETLNKASSSSSSKMDLLQGEIKSLIDELSSYKLEGLISVERDKFEEIRAKYSENPVV